MAAAFLSPDPVEQAVRRTLRRLSEDKPPNRGNRRRVHVMEEPKPRNPEPADIGGRTRNEQAARSLAGVMACFADTPGGGAVILGASDDGTRIGTSLSEVWLRRRIWELTDRNIDVTVRCAEVGGARLLVLSCQEALEPAHGGNPARRAPADDSPRRQPGEHRNGDWSARPSDFVLSDVDPFAVHIARRWLRLRWLQHPDRQMVDASERDLLRRLNVLTGQDRLTNAGALLFAATPHAGIDYTRRETPGGDIHHRIKHAGPLLVQVDDAVKSANRANRVFHVPRELCGLVVAQHPAIPVTALREAVVNGVLHRDWQSPLPTVVEHTGDMLVVTSPGGLHGGVTAENIFTHPPVPRYPSLATAAAGAGIGAAEGGGAGLMAREMLASGLAAPEFSEVGGPYFRVGLFGGEPDRGMLELLTALRPRALARSLDVLTLLNLMRRRGRVDVPAAAAALRRPPGEAGEVVRLLRQARAGRAPVVAAADAPTDRPVYRFTKAARSLLGSRFGPSAAERTAEGH